MGKGHAVYRCKPTICLKKKGIFNKVANKYTMFKCPSATAVPDTRTRATHAPMTMPLLRSMLITQVLSGLMVVSFAW